MHKRNHGDHKNHSTTCKEPHRLLGHILLVGQLLEFRLIDYIMFCVAREGVVLHSVGFWFIVDVDANPVVGADVVCQSVLVGFIEVDTNAVVVAYVVRNGVEV